jgi:hypothetical protein
MLAFAGSLVAASLWFTTLIAVPEFQRSSLSLIVPRVVVHLLLLAGTWEGLRRTSLTASERMWTWIGIAVPLTIWLGGAWLVVAEGLLRTGATRIPLLPVLVLVPTVIANVLLWRSRRIGMLLDAVPATWLIGLQFYRVVGGVFFLGWIIGSVPAAFAWPAGTGDVITGLMALPVAAAVARGRSGSTRAAFIWNLFGVGDLILAIVMGALTSPGPLQHFAFDHPNLMVGAYPTAIIPAFTVPTSLILHVLSLRQLRKRTRRAMRAVVVVA